MGCAVGNSGLACRRRPVLSQFYYTTWGRTCQVLFSKKMRTLNGFALLYNNFFDSFITDNQKSDKCNHVHKWYNKENATLDEVENSSQKTVFLKNCFRVSFTEIINRTPNSNERDTERNRARNQIPFQKNHFILLSNLIHFF